MSYYIFNPFWTKLIQLEYSNTMINIIKKIKKKITDYDFRFDEDYMFVSDLSETPLWQKILSIFLLFLLSALKIFLILFVSAAFGIACTKLWSYPEVIMKNNVVSIDNILKIFSIIDKSTSILFYISLVYIVSITLFKCYG